MSLYGIAYRQFLWPLYETLRGRHTCRLIRQAEQSQWQNAEQLRQFQWQELQKLLRHACEFSPWHRQRFTTLGIVPADITSIEQFRRLPLLTKTDIRRNRDQIRATSCPGKVAPHSTGGSTGAPIQFYINYPSYEWRRAMTARGYNWAGAADGERSFWLWSTPAGTLSRWKQTKMALHNRCMRHGFFNNFRLSKTTLPECLDALNRFKPRVLAGYTSMLEYLARYIQKNGGLKVRFHSVLTAAEGVNAAQRELFKEVFQAPVFASYGCREFMLVAMECEQGQLHLSAENLLVECLHKGQPAEPGQPGEVVVTDLHNYAFPFLRYSLGDVASPSTQSCPCGRGLPLLDAVHGRIPDTIQTPDGRLISGIFFPHLLKEFIWIEQFQVIQKQLDHVLVKLLPTDPNEAARQLPAVETQIRSVLGDAIRIEFEFCAEIPRNATGKHRAVISEIPVKI